MAGRKENLKALFSNTRSRVIIIFTVLVLLITVSIGLFKVLSITNPVSKTSVDLSNAPGGIQSIPGKKDQTAQYAALQQAQNVSQARNAAATGKSAIPTIISTQGFGEGVQQIGPKNGEGGVGFETLARENITGPQQSLWLQSLKNANCSQSSVNTVINQGAALIDLKVACTCVQLKDDGYNYTDLKSICSCKELKAAGYNARQMKDAGSTAAQLRSCGFDACELRAAGFTAQQMKDGGYSDGELKGAGFSDTEIARTAGLPDGITADDVHKAGCQTDALIRLRKAGVTASAIRHISGCSAAQLKAAGFSAGALRDAGFSAADLLKAGFTPTELKQAGYSARDLLDAGVTPADILAAGYTPQELKEAEAKLPNGVTAESIKAAGCSVEALKRERLAGISAIAIHQDAGCSPEELNAAGFTNADIANAGFTPAEIGAISPTVGDDLIKAAGCDPKKLHDLLLQHVSAKRIHDLNGCGTEALKAAGYSAQQLADAGFTPQQLLQAGFTPAEIAANPAEDTLIKAAGCDPQKLHALYLQKISAKRIHDLNGCSPAALKAAGFSAKELADAGFTPEELLAAGFSPQELMQAGLSPVGIIAAGRTANCSVDSLKAAHALGVSAATIKQTLGCSAKQMKDAGYTAKELKDAGFTAADLKDAGFSAGELKAAGFSAKELHAAGFSAQQLKDAGFSAAELKDAGFSAADLKSLGFTAAQLKALGYSAKELKDAGFSAEALRNAGYSSKELKDAGLTSTDLKKAGFSAEALQEAGFSPNDTALAGLQAITPPSPGSIVVALPSLNGGTAQNASVEAANAKQLQAILNRQQTLMADQQFQQKVQQRAAAMQGAASAYLGVWKIVAAQAPVAGTPPPSLKAGEGAVGGNNLNQQSIANPAAPNAQPIIKAGDVLFAVLDTSVNSDEPGPILATIVSGKLNGTKLIGAFNLPTNSDKIVINFNTMSVPGAPKTTSINAYAIDPNTARTALATKANHHYLLRYGSLFASTFIEGFGNAFQSANTTVTIGGVGGATNTTIENGVGRTTLENAVIGLATLGKAWGQVAQAQFNTPTTVQVCSGTGIGVLFTQDLASL